MRLDPVQIDRQAIDDDVMGGGLRQSADVEDIAWRAFFDASDRAGDFGFIVHSIATMVPYGQQG
jgi:hypothetical protein